LRQNHNYYILDTPQEEPKPGLARGGTEPPRHLSQGLREKPKLSPKRTPQGGKEREGTEDTGRVAD